MIPKLWKIPCSYRLCDAKQLKRVVMWREGYRIKIWDDLRNQFPGNLSLRFLKDWGVANTKVNYWNRMDASGDDDSKLLA